MTNKEKINILFIDDEEQWREYAKEKFDVGNSSCVAVDSIEKASLEMKKKGQSFNYLIMDWGIGFPGKDGPQNSRELALSAKLAGISVIVMTGHLLVETMEILAGKKIPYYEKAKFPEIVNMVKK